MKNMEYGVIAEDDSSLVEDFLSSASGGDRLSARSRGYEIQKRMKTSPDFADYFIDSMVNVIKGFEDPTLINNRAAFWLNALNWHFDIGREGVRRSFGIDPELFLKQIYHAVGQKLDEFRKSRGWEGEHYELDTSRLYHNFGVEPVVVKTVGTRTIKSKFPWKKPKVEEIRQGRKKTIEEIIAEFLGK